MKKPQPEKIVVPYPDPPDHLSDRSKLLWRAIGPVEVRSLGRQVLFQVALEALDSADAARRIVAIEGITSKTESTGAFHVHPAVKIEREMRQQFTKIWSTLSLTWKGGGSPFEAV